MNLIFEISEMFSAGSSPTIKVFKSFKDINELVNDFNKEYSFCEEDLTHKIGDNYIPTINNAKCLSKKYHKNYHYWLEIITLEKIEVM